MSNSGFEFLEYIPDEDIRREADNYRQRICPGGELPLDIFNIIEFDEEIEIIPISGLRGSADTETILLSDFKTILIDNDEFLDPRKENRLRFTLAHELGHICLHKNKAINFFPENIDEYIEIMMSVDESQYSRFEFQAYEFAGRLLVPIEELKNEVIKLNNEIDKYLQIYPGGGNDMIPYLAPKINGKFGVSTDVIERRLEKEGIDFLNL